MQYKVSITIFMIILMNLYIAKLEQMYESEIKKLRTDGETTSTKLKAELNSIMHERDSTNQKVNELTS